MVTMLRVWKCCWQDLSLSRALMIAPFIIYYTGIREELSNPVFLFGFACQMGHLCSYQHTKYHKRKLLSFLFASNCNLFIFPEYKVRSFLSIYILISDMQDCHVIVFFGLLFK